MSEDNIYPWISGPRDILNHALHLRKKNSDMNRKLAMILFDNAIEIMVHTFLTLPKDITNIKVSKKELANVDSFPKLINMLYHKTKGILTKDEINRITYYHRLRNRLYHEGDGITVSKDNLDIYSNIACCLFCKLFKIDLGKNISYETELKQKIIEYCARLEKAAHFGIEVNACLGEESEDVIGYENNQFDEDFYYFSENLKKKFTKKEFSNLRDIFICRNRILSISEEYEEGMLEDILDNLSKYVDRVEKKS